MFVQFATATQAAGSAFAQAVSDLAILRAGADTLLVMTNPGFGGVTVFRLAPGAAPVPVQGLAFPGDGPEGGGTRLAVLETPEGARLLIGGGFGAGPLMRAPGPDGLLGPAELLGVGLRGVAAMAQSGAGLHLALPGEGRLVTLDPESGAEIASLALPVHALAALHWQGDDLLFVADAAGGGISLHRIDPQSGAPGVALATAPSGVGIAAPVAMEAFVAHGAATLVVAGAQSQSLSVLRIAEDGRLAATDHLLDTLGTRFGGVQALEVVQAGEHVFVLAAGADDGVSLFTLLPDGRLLHLQSIEATPDRPLFDVTAIAAHVLGDEIQVFLGSGPQAVQLTLPVAPLGAVIRSADALIEGTAGNDVLAPVGGGSLLRGGAGDDILLAGTGPTTLEGGAGADIFVMRAGTGPTLVTDFEPGTDRLDLSDFFLLRSPDQLDIQTQPTGARIMFRAEEVIIESVAGVPLTRDDLFGRVFEGPDRLLLVTSAEVLADGDSGSGEPDPLPPDPDPSAPPPARGTGVVHVRLADGTAEPFLAGAVLVQTAPDGSRSETPFDASGTVSFPVAPEAGTRIDILRGHAAGDPSVGVADALAILRLSVGLALPGRDTRPEDFIAGDLDRDGRVSVGDALTVLRAAVGLPTGDAPRWVFLDPDADIAGATAQSVPLHSGMMLGAADLPVDIGFDAILLGNLTD